MFAFTQLISWTLDKFINVTKGVEKLLHVILRQKESWLTNIYKHDAIHMIMKELLNSGAKL